MLIVSALQLMELFLVKMASEYKPPFHREDVLHKIKIIADQQLMPKPKEPEPTQLPPPVSLCSPHPWPSIYPWRNTHHPMF